MDKRVLVNSGIENSPLAFTLNKVIFNSQGAPIDFKLLSVNPAFEKKMGYLGKDIIGQKLTEWLLRSKTLQELWLPTFIQAASLERYECEEILEISSHYYNVTAFVPGTGYLVILFNEIAIPKLDGTKKSMQKALETFNARSSRLFQYSPDAIIFYEVQNNGTTGNDYIIKAVNPKCLETEGWVEDEVIGKSIKQLRPGIDEFGIISAFRKAWQTGKPVHYPTRVYKEKDADKWFENVIFKVSPYEIVAIYVDVTDKVNADKALFAEKERLRITLYSIGEGVIVTDKAGRIELLNTVAEQLTGWSNKDAQGQLLDTLFEVYNERTGDRCTEMLNYVLQEGAIEKDCTVLKSKNGDKKFVSIVATPIKEQGDQILGVVLVFKDITQEREKQAKIEYLSYRDSLTGLYNRHYFRKAYKRIVSQAYLPLTLIMGDLVGLKLINDAFGHHAGDKVIIMIADALKRCRRKGDIIFRWGGDEFLVLLPNTSEEEGRNVRNAIIRECSSLKIKNIDLNISFGRATRTALEQTFEEMLIVAEDKMYKNKLLTSKFYRNNVLNSIKQMLFEKSHETEEHGHRIGELCKKVGVKLGLPTDKLDDLEIFASLHDIGKIAIDNTILEKPGKLSAREWKEIHKHPETGYRIAASILELNDVAEYILSHHERWDGKGYPRGLQGEDIPLLARILSVADAFDAMTQERTYRKALTREEARAELVLNAGTQFDPNIVEIFLEVLDD